MPDDIASTIRKLTLADASVSHLVGTRMYADMLPQTVTMPAISYSVIETLSNEYLGGVANVSRARLQIDCYGKTRVAANDLANKVRLALEMQHRGDNSGQFINTLSMPDGERHAIDRAELGSDQRRYVTILEFLIHYNVTTP